MKKWVVNGTDSGEVMAEPRKGDRVQRTQRSGVCGGRLGGWDENRDQVG